LRTNVRHGIDNKTGQRVAEQDPVVPGILIGT